MLPKMDHFNVNCILIGGECFCLIRKEVELNIYAERFWKKIGMRDWKIYKLKNMEPPM